MKKTAWKPCIAQGLDFISLCKYAKPVTVVEKYGTTKREIEIDACLSPKRKCSAMIRTEK